MVPLGYVTLHELVRMGANELEAEKKHPDWPWWKFIDEAVTIFLKTIKSGELTLYIEKDGRMYRIPAKDVSKLEDYLPNVVHPMMEAGWFPQEPTAADLEEEAKDKAEDPSVEEYYSLLAGLFEEYPQMRAYCGVRPLVTMECVNQLFPPKTPERPWSSGVPGRPSSKNRILVKHAERVRAGEAEPTRTAEAKWLEKWNAETNPSGPTVGWKAIYNFLPTRNARRGDN
jgi:hypothetical protein